jgi:DNA-directed RNA polymerase specialized sigma24 family protein
MIIQFPTDKSGKRSRRSENASSAPPSPGTVSQRAAVAVALRGLAPDQQTAIVETYFRGRSVREAAGVIGVSPELLKTRIYDAMCALNRALSQMGVARAA